MDLSGLIFPITGYFNHYLYITLFVLIFIEEASIPLPLPGDTWIFLAGTQMHKYNMNPLFIVIDVVVASILGSTILYWIFYKYGEPLVKRYGRYIFISEKKLQKGKAFSDKYGEKMVLFGRWIPGFRIVLTVVSGVLKLSYSKFIFSIFISSTLWAIFFLYFGDIAKTGYRVIKENLFGYIFSSYAYYIVIIIILIGFLYFYHRKAK